MEVVLAVVIITNYYNYSRPTCFGLDLQDNSETGETGTVVEFTVCHLQDNCVYSLQQFLVLLLLLLVPPSTVLHIVLLSLQQLKTADVSK